tara:strand:+ start:36555 stop:37496 length:942 start_codon:yes stop_codon:yes gene_type:complete
MNTVHHYLEVNACRIHVVEAGAGPAVLLCHGFPEYWRSWRKQIPALVDAGYRVLAFDMRGHGESDAPAELDRYSVAETVGDVIGVMDALAIGRAAIVGHDAGTTTAYHAALMRPDRIRGVMGLSVPYIPRGPHSLIGALRASMPPEFYMLYFQEEGRGEADLGADPRKTLERLFFANSGEYADAPIMMMAKPGGGLVENLPSPPQPMGFIDEEELQAYCDLYATTGFRGGLNGYRVFDLNWQITAPWHDAPLPVPNAFVGGTLDTVLHFPGFREAAERMDRATFIDGAGHWIHAEYPERVNNALMDFLATLSD